jgi:hypothetical protein
MGSTLTLATSLDERVNLGVVHRHSQPRIRAPGLISPLGGGRAGNPGTGNEPTQSSVVLSFNVTIRPLKVPERVTQLTGFLSFRRMYFQD